jgi:hypothetical protein
MGGGSSTILNAVSRTCMVATGVPANYSGSVYDCAGHADALRQLA